jgi:hypothetical protein
MSECKNCKQLMMFDKELICDECIENLTGSAYATKYIQYYLQLFIDHIEEYEHVASTLIRDFCIEDKKLWIKFLLEVLEESNDI